jgi:hypothetical protein
MLRHVHSMLAATLVMVAACGGKDQAADPANRDLRLVNGVPVPDSLTMSPQEMQQLQQSPSGQWVYIPAGYRLVPDAAPVAAPAPAPRTMVRTVSGTRAAAAPAPAGTVTGAVIDHSLKGAVIGAVAGGALGAVVGSVVDVDHR